MRDGADAASNVFGEFDFLANIGGNWFEGAFPDGQSCLNQAAARLRHIAASKWSTRKYMNMEPLFAEQNQSQGAVA